MLGVSNFSAFPFVNHAGIIRPHSRGPEGDSPSVRYSVRFAGPGARLRRPVHGAVASQSAMPARSRALVGSGANEARTEAEASSASTSSE